jgi:hypothetical protein
VNDSDPALNHTRESYWSEPPSAMASLNVYLVPATTETDVVFSIVVTPSSSVFRVSPTFER